MNFKKWTSALTLCAFTFAATFVGGAPAKAFNDTASVGDIVPNLQAAADAMNAATQHLNGGVNTPQGNTSGSGNGTTQQPSGGDTDTLGYDYVTLADPAVTFDGQVYLPLRSTFTAMKGESLEPTWRPDGQDKIKLTGHTGTFEVYLTADGAGVQIQKGGTTYTLKNINGVTYVPLTFFQAMIQVANVGLSGNDLLILETKDGSASVWNNATPFWIALNAYQVPVVQPPVVVPPVTTPQTQPAPQPQPQKPSAPQPDVTYPNVEKPVPPAPQPQQPQKPSAPSTPPQNSQPSNGPTIQAGPGVTTSVVPVKSCPGGKGLIADTLFWPTKVTYVSSLYGLRMDPVGGLAGDFHLGVDIAGPIGTPVYAAQAGKVIRASWFSTYGNCIDIQHPSGLITRYAHLNAYTVRVGDTVRQGQHIAAMGATGNVTGPHVHFETIINGNTVDPANYINIDAVM